MTRPAAPPTPQGEPEDLAPGRPAPEVRRRRLRQRRKQGVPASGLALRRALAAEQRRASRISRTQLADALVLYLAMVGINLVRFGTDWPTYPLSHYAVGFAVATALHLAVYYFSGLYEPQPRLGAQPWLPRVARGTLVAVLLDAAVALATGRYLMPRGNLVALLVVATLAVTAVRQVQRVLVARRQGPPRVLLVGPEAERALAHAHLPESDRTAVVVGETEGADTLMLEAGRAGATEVLLLNGDLLDAVYPGPLAELEARGVKVLQRITGAQTLLGLQAVREVGGMPFVALQTHTLPLSQARLKRYLELLVLLVAAPVVVPLTAAVALYVRVVAGSPVLFRQERVGRAGEVFTMLKFRTMHPPEPGAPPTLTEVGDPRVVPACRMLRSTRLDELPQLWHVLRGQMSLVGPRPERPELTAEFERLIAGYARRYEIPPGITGLAQVRGRYATDPEYKLGHDLQYLVNWSPARDLQILLTTMWVVVGRRV
jgi:lipopolysaccharide/colanic/teichoic acid biosynthesis glycosyltransferase